MKNKMSVEEFKQYVLSEAQKLYKIEVLKEEKERLEKELSILNENTPPLELGLTLMDPEVMKKLRQDMIRRAAGWAFTEPKQNLDENKYSEKASNFIGKEIGHLQKDKNYPHDRAVAAAINVAKDKGYKVPPAKNEISQVFAGTDVTNPDAKMYFFKIHHDKGVDKLKIADFSQENAKKVIAKFMNAPESAVEFVKEAPIGVKQ